MSEDPSRPKQYHYTYEITNIYNGMRYFGARSCNCLPRDDTKYMGSSRHLNKAIREEGLSHFSKLVLAVFPTREKALEYEVFLHNRFNVNKDPMFYNKAKQTSTRFNFRASGPDHYNYGKHPKGRKLTEEEKEKLVQAAIKANTGRKHSEESKQNHSIAMKGKYTGEENAMYGKHHSEETRKKMSEKRKGTHPSEETRKRMSISGKKKIRTPKTGRAQSEAQLGKKNAQYGKSPSQETLNKRKASWDNYCTKIYVTPLGEFHSAAAAGRLLQCSGTTVSRRCRDKFEGYDLKLSSNKKEEFKNLLEKGVGVTEIARILEIHRSTISHWKRELNLSEPKETAPIDPSWQKNYCC